MTDSEKKLWVTFLGTTTLYIHTSQTALLTDGFFSRPSLKEVLVGKISPRPDRIASALASASIQGLDAVLVGHSHYDHALDAPEVARQTGSLLVGSESSAQIGRGWGLPEDQICVIPPGVCRNVGEFGITFIPSKHSQPLLYQGTIPRPLVPPARAAEYREGGSYSIWITSPFGSILVQESANMIAGSLPGRKAGTVFLSVAQLGRRPANFIRRYFQETVLAVEARLVVPIHWDNFQKPAQPSLDTFPIWMDDTRRGMSLIHALCSENQIQFQKLPYGKTIEITS